MTIYSEKQIQQLIRKVLLGGILAGGFASAAGLAMGIFSKSASQAGEQLILCGMLILLMTPVARVAMLAYAYTRAKKYRYALAAATVLFFIFMEFVIGR